MVGLKTALLTRKLESIRRARQKVDIRQKVEHARTRVEIPDCVEVDLFSTKFHLCHLATCFTLSGTLILTAKVRRLEKDGEGIVQEMRPIRDSRHVPGRIVDSLRLK